MGARLSFDDPLCPAVSGHRGKPRTEDERHRINSPPPGLGEGLEVGAHSTYSGTPTTKVQLVVPLPPMFSVATFFAPLTW